MHNEKRDFVFLKGLGIVLQILSVIGLLSNVIFSGQGDIFSNLVYLSFLFIGMHMVKSSKLVLCFENLQEEVKNIDKRN